MINAVKSLELTVVKKSCVIGNTVDKVLTILNKVKIPVFELCIEDKLGVDGAVVVDGLLVINEDFIVTQTKDFTELSEDNLNRISSDLVDAIFQNEAARLDGNEITNAFITDVKEFEICLYVSNLMEASIARINKELDLNVDKVTLLRYGKHRVSNDFGLVLNINELRALVVDSIAMDVGVILASKRILELVRLH